MEIIGQVKTGEWLTICHIHPTPKFSHVQYAFKMIFVIKGCDFNFIFMNGG